MKRKLLSMVLCICLLTLLFPVSAMAYVPPELMVDGTNATVTASGAGWRFDKDTHTLTLEGYNGGPIETVADLTIVVKGQNTITVANDPSAYAINAGFAGQTSTLTVRGATGMNADILKIGQNTTRGILTQGNCVIANVRLESDYLNGNLVNADKSIAVTDTIIHSRGLCSLQGGNVTLTRVSGFVGGVEATAVDETKPAVKITDCADLNINAPRAVTGHGNVEISGGVRMIGTYGVTAYAKGSQKGDIHADGIPNYLPTPVMFSYEGTLSGNAVTGFNGILEINKTDTVTGNAALIWDYIVPADVTFTTPAASTLEVKSGATLDLSQAAGYTLSGAVTNNGIIRCKNGLTADALEALPITGPGAVISGALAMVDKKVIAYGGELPSLDLRSLSLTTATVFSCLGGVVVITPANASTGTSVEVTLNGVHKFNGDPELSATAVNGLALPEGAVTLRLLGNNNILTVGYALGADALTVVGDGVLELVSVSKDTPAAKVNALTMKENGSLALPTNVIELNGAIPAILMPEGAVPAISGTAALRGFTAVAKADGLHLTAYGDIERDPYAALNLSGYASVTFAPEATLQNESVLILPANFDVSVLHTLKIEGNGTVQIGNELYANHGEHIEKVLQGDLDLRHNDYSGATLEADGFAWDAASKTLTVDNLSVQGSIFLPENTTATVVIGSLLHTNEIYSGTGLTVKGGGTLYGGYIHSMSGGGPMLAAAPTASAAGETPSAGGMTFEDITLYGMPENYDDASEAVLVFRNATVISTALHWKTLGGIRLENSRVTVNRHFWTEKLVMDDGSLLTMHTGLVNNGLVSGGLDGLKNFLPEGYTVGSVTVENGPMNTILDAEGVQAKDITLKQQGYTITPTVGEGGALVVVQDGGEAPAETLWTRANTSVTYAIRPQAGYAIADVLVDGVSVGRVSTYTFENISANHTISVLFGAVYNVIDDEKTVTVYSLNGSKPVSLHVDGDLTKFVSVMVDGVLVAPENYTATAGSTIITFKPEYLKTLSTGRHTVTVNFTDGTATAVLTLTNAPATGDSSSVMLYIALGACALLGTAVVLGKKKELL